MQTFFSLNVLLLISAVVVNIILGIVVYKNKPQSATNISYSLLSVVISVWLVANFTSLHPSFLNLSLFWIRLSIFFAMPLSSMFYVFARAFPEDKLSIGKKFIFLIILINIFVMGLNISPYAFTGVEVISGSPKPISGLGLLPFAVFSTGFILLAIYELIKKFRTSKNEEARIVGAVLFGILLMMSLIIGTVFIPVSIYKNSFFVPFIPLYTLIFLGITAYAIVRYHLFHIKVIATEALTLSIWIILLAKIFAADTLSQKITDSVVLTVVFVFGILLIKTVRKEVEQRERLEVLSKQLGEANEKLKELDHLKSEFLSFASHQIKAPLAAIKGFATFIYDGTYAQSPDKVIEAGHKIKDSADRMVQLVNDFLNIRKIEEGRMEYKFEKINVALLVNDIFEELKPLAQNKKLDFSLEALQGGGWIKGDAQNIRQVFQNLIENSIKYTDTGFVKVKTESYAGQFIFSVSDSGHGISQELLPHLFEEFKRDSTTRQIEGSGLGLFIARAIVLAHHGEIWVESDGQGKGSKFLVKLPLV